MLDLAPPPLILPPSFNKLAKPALIRPAEKKLLVPRPEPMNFAMFMPGIGRVNGHITYPQGVLTGRGGFADQVDRTTYTWSSMATGTASPTRNVIIGAVGFSTGNMQTVTAAGFPLTKAAGSGGAHGIWYGNVPTGTTATIVCTFDPAGGGNVGLISGWTFDNGHADLDVLSIGVGLGAPSSMFLPVGSAGFAYARNVGGPYTTTWTGMTANYSSGSQDTGYLGTAHVNGGTSAATITVDSTQSSYTWAVLQ